MTDIYGDLLATLSKDRPRSPPEYAAAKGFVLDLARAAEDDGIKVDTICAKIVRDLKGRLSVDVIRATLPNKYKNQVMQQRSRMQKPGSAIPEDLDMTKEGIAKRRDKVLQELAESDEKPTIKGPREIAEVIDRKMKEIKPTSNILKGSIRSRAQEAVVNGEKLDEAVVQETAQKLEEDRKKFFAPPEQNNHVHAEVVVRAGKVTEDIARILLRSRPYNEIYLRLRRGTNLVDMVESDADRTQNKTKWMGVPRR